MRKFICVSNNKVVCIKDIDIEDLEEKLNCIYDITDASAIDTLDPIRALVKVNKVLDSYCDDITYFDLINYNTIEITNSEGNVISIVTK